MCGCFTRHRSWAEIHACLNLIGPAINLQARYNIAPSQEAGVVRAEADGLGLSMLRWGLIPGWARVPAIAYKTHQCESRAPRGSLAEYRMGDTIETFTILSTAANATLTPIHHRMPVILSPGAFETWLSGGNVALDPTPETLLAVHPVSTRVNSPRHDDPECIAPTSLA